MRYLFEYWGKLKQGLSNKYIFLFLDYDGTLTPIVESPDKAVILKETKELLGKLSNMPNCKLAIISGRSLKDIKNRVGLKGITYVGNHGLEIEGPKIKFESPVSLRYKNILQDIKDDLQLKLATIKGAFVEDKGLSLSIHYRLVDRSQIPKLNSILHEATVLYTVRDKIKIKPGKKVFEIRPSVEWDKGKVVLWLLARWKFALDGKDTIPIYLGDDISDEDAFGVLKKYLPAGRQEGITIFVGKPQKSDAQYYLKDTQEVKDFLNRIAKLP